MISEKKNKKPLNNENIEIEMEYIFWPKQQNLVSVLCKSMNRSLLNAISNIL